MKIYDVKIEDGSIHCIMAEDEDAARLIIIREKPGVQVTSISVRGS